MITDPLFYVAAVPAVILWGLSKGGFAGLSALSLPIMALVISPLRAASIVLPILIAQDVVSVWAYRRSWDKRNLTILIPSAAAGIALGYFFAAWVSDAALALALGLISVTFAIRRLILEARPVPPHPTEAKLVPGIVWGTLAGFTSLIANAGGPPFQVYIVPQRLPRDVFVGTGVILFAVVNWIKVPPFIALGLFNEGNLLTAAVLLPLALLSTWAGVKLVRRVSADRFYKLIYSLLILVGTKLIWSGVEGML
jgi:uncharacterized membrane protein YfcA